MKRIDLTGDGACSGNPGIGAWAYILEYNGIRRRKAGLEKNTTTNNRMEMTAIIEGLKAIREPCIVNIWTDSRQVADPFNKGWIDKWKQNDFEGRANTDLWKILLEELSKHSFTITYIPRNSTPNHDECDKIAKHTIKHFKGEKERLTRGEGKCPYCGKWNDMVDAFYQDGEPIIYKCLYCKEPFKESQIKEGRNIYV